MSNISNLYRYRTLIEYPRVIPHQTSEVTNSPIPPYSSAILTGMKRLLPVLMGFALLLLSSTEGWSLPPCPGSPLTGSVSDVRSWNYCSGTHIFGPNTNWAGYMYIGEWKNGRPHGQGTGTFSAPHKSAGAKYVGERRDGKYHGQGTLTFSAPHKLAGEKQVGEFRNGKMHGQGTLTFSAPHKSAGAKYVGEFRDGKYHGQGTATWSAPSPRAGHNYVGEFRDGKRHGQGTYTFPRGSKSAVCCKYVGEWQNDFPNGLGIHTYADGRVEEGMYKNGKFQYAQKVTPTVTGRKSAPPSPSAAEIENERLRRENARLKKQNQSKPKPKPSPKSATSGSGFFISKLGHVLTNQHVVDKCESVTVGDNSKKQVTANVLETDRRNDLALLKISNMQMASAETKSLIRKLGIKVVPLASDGLMRSEDVELGERVLVAGYPYGEIFSNTIKVTGGMVSAVRGLGDDSGQFQIDAAVQPGNSGGPIYDENGNIVGVVVSQLNKMKFAKRTGSIPENVNFGIKASTVRQFLTSSGLPTKWSKRSIPMSTKEIAKIAKSQTVMVVCHQ
jgi:S1-C subfamily serine protease